jgi:Peptidase family M28
MSSLEPTSRTPDLEHVVRELASWERPSASAGERRAAEWIAGRLRELGVEEVRIEEEPAHGGYWWPLGMLSAASGVAALLRGRLLRVVVGAVAALGIWDELGLHRGVWTRRFVRTRTTTNVVAEFGARDADQCVVIIAHHDAAHSGAVFDPTVPYALARRFPHVLDRMRWWPRIMGLVFAGPVLVALGRRRLGAALCFGSAAAFADIGRSKVVPGANDNLSGVAALIAVAEALVRRPVGNIRVILLSAGSEESFEEGSQGFLRRHRDELDAHRMHVIAIDAVGSSRLVLVEGEGMLRHTEYDRPLKDTIGRAADQAEVPIIREHWLSFGSDALAGIRAGYPSALVASFNEHKLPANYHWPTDVPDNVDFDTIAGAATVVEGAVRLLGDAG